MKPSNRTYQRSLIAAAIAAALAGPAVAQTTTISGIEQRISGDLIQEALNQGFIDAIGRNAAASVGLALDASGNATVGTIQLGALQANTFGWSTLAGNRDSAVTVGGVGLALLQTFDGSSTPAITAGDITQNVTNAVAVTAAPAFGTAGSASILGVGQIGANTYATAGVNFTAPTADFVLRQDLTSSSAGTLQQTVLNSLSAVVGGNGIGSAIIDGQSGTGSALSSAIQYGVNTVASAAVFGSGNTISMQALQAVGPYTAGGTDGINSIIVNQASASAVNATPPIPSPTIGSSGPLIDPAIRNLDQIAVYSANAITGNNPGGTIRLVGGESLLQTFNSGSGTALTYDPTAGQFGSGTGVGYPQYVGIDGFDAVVEQSAIGISGQLASLNLATAINGTTGATPAGGIGDSALSKIGQTISASLNSVAITGTAAVVTNGTTTTPANPANAEVGKLVYSGQLPTGYSLPGSPGLTTLSLANGTFGVGLASFDQVVSGLNVARLEVGTNVLGANIGAGIGITNAFSDSDPNGVLGNYALSTTGTGNAGIANLTQLLNLSANTFSVDGNLTGATLPTQISPSVATYSYFQEGSSGVDLSTILANVNNWSMTQSATDVSVSLPNYAFAAADVGNASLGALSQTLVTRINDIAAGGALTGNYLQTGSGATSPTSQFNVALDNIAQATTNVGNVTGLDTRTQLSYASLNSLSAGGNFSGVLDQRAEGIRLVGGYDPDNTPAATIAALPFEGPPTIGLPMLNSMVLNVATAGNINVAGVSQTNFANLNSMSLGGSVNGTLSQSASDVTHSALNNINASTALGTVALGGVSQTIVSSINTMALGNAVAAAVNQVASGGVTQVGQNLATVGGVGSSLASVAGINQVVSNRVNAITSVAR
ncbi:MAG: hypothetical protein RIS35_3317 [Pseudomonadota bacterium]